MAQRESSKRNRFFRRQIHHSLGTLAAVAILFAASALGQTAEQHMAAGMALRNQGRMQDAATEMEKALQANPRLKGARAVLGLTFLQSGDTAKAVSQLEQALREDPSSVDAAGWLGMAYVAAARYREAVPKLETAIAAKPDDIEFLGYLDRAYTGATGEITEKLERLAQTNPQAHIALAETYAAAGLRDDAIREYAAAGDNVPLGDLYMDSKNFSAAETAYRRALQDAPNAPAVQFRLGSALAELGRDEEALPLLKSAVKAQPDIGAAWVYLGKVQMDLNHLPEADGALNKALTLSLDPATERAARFALESLRRRAK